MTNDLASTPQASIQSSIVTTPLRWFLRGVLVGVLISASLHAISYFFRSEGWGNLLGTTPEHEQAIGFPLEVWESGHAYSGYYIETTPLVVDGLFGIAVAAICGLVAVMNRERLNRLVQELERTASPPQNKFQFSLRGLLLATALAAVAAAGARHLLAGRPEVLGAIYLFGPWMLLMIAYLPRRIPWQHRAMILIPMALLLMLAAIAAGASLAKPLEFDRVLLGIFICWTPQSALAAIGLTLAIVFFHRSPAN